MTELNKREFNGIPIEGDRGYTRTYRAYTPRPITELYPYFKAAFESGITAVTWHQYTPRFNDGDICEFSVYDLCVTSNEEVAENWLNGDFYEDRIKEISKEEFIEATTGRYRSYGYYEGDGGKFYREFQEGTYDYIPGSSHPDDIEEVDIPIGLIEFEDALKSVFGDGTQVVVSPSRVVQFDYDHD